MHRPAPDKRCSRLGEQKDLENARRAVDALREVGAEPNFFIVGAQKCGTTSLSAFLEADDQVFISAIKEPNFLASDVRPENFAPTMRQLHLQDDWEAVDRSHRERVLYAYIHEPEAYAALFEQAAGYSLRGECSVTYLYSRTAAETIAEVLPDAKILIVLRDPVSRAFSHYRMQRRAGAETEDDFATAVLKDHAIESLEWGSKHLYAEAGLYARQLKNYYEMFPPGQIYVATFEAMTRSPATELAAIRRFLGLRGNVRPELPAENVGSAPRSQRLNSFLYRSGLKRAVTRIAPRSLTRAGKKIYYGSHDDELSASAREQLAPLFEGEAEEITRITGRSVPWH